MCLHQERPAGHGGRLSQPALRPEIQKFSWIEALAVVSDPDAVSQPLGHLYTAYDAFYAKSVVTKENAPLTPAAWLSHATWNPYRYYLVSVSIGIVSNGYLYFTY